MNLKVSKNIETLSRDFADWLVACIKEVLSKQDRFTIALAGGNTPRRLYQMLASEEYRDKVDWKRIHFFWGDERHVPFDDPRNNAQMAFINLLNRVPFVKEQAHIINTNLEPMESAEEYEKILRNFFPAADRTFDLLLLGLGDNAHTLSLFPGYDVVMEKRHWVRSYYLAEQSMYRITLTAPVANKAAAIIFLVSGKDKAAAVKKVFEGEYNPGKFPAQVIKPVKGDVYWWLDEEAAGSTI